MRLGKKLTKGERTAVRILDAAEELFASKGYEAVSLREIAASAGVHEPGLYHYFKGKTGLYSAVLERALAPMADILSQHIEGHTSLGEQVNLPLVMMDLYLEHPTIAGLFSQAMQGDLDSVGNRLVKDWLDQLFTQGMATMESLGRSDIDKEELALQVIAMYNLTTGYFLSQRALATMTGGDIYSASTVARQKNLIARLQRAMMIS